MTTKINKSPQVWIIIAMVILPNLSESIYSPILPDISKAFNISESLAETTLTLYLFGYAFGMLLWGSLSDRIGRKPSLLIGFSTYTLGCIGCYLATTIDTLLLSRIVQAFGGSAGSVIGYAISRDAFTLNRRSSVFSLIGSSLAIAPALGPIAGGLLDQYFGWFSIFPVLIGLAVFMCLSILTLLPETRPDTIEKQTKLLQGFSILLTNPKTLACAFLTGCSISVGFCYFQESPFYFKHILHLSPSLHGLMFIFIAAAWFIGGQISHQLATRSLCPRTIIQYGCRTSIIGSSILLVSLFTGLLIHPNIWLACGALMLSTFVIMAGLGLVIPNSIALGLEPYQKIAGTASSIYGFIYYGICTIITLIMSFIHDGTEYPLPIFFFTLCFSVALVFDILKRYEKKFDPTTS
ncbi:MAG TPA: multidrug effflux MFS transporter [Gammaproteobacteria bacterium]|nr:multidrug effflux MFS transporter [Gammaproteobacteria bacterium]